MKYDFIDSTKNDILSDLRGIDLQNLLLQTEKYLLMYRIDLGLPSDVTFGCEIEYEGISKSITDKYIDKYLSDWASDIDISLKTGGEIKSPIMTDDIKCWQELQKICKYLSRKNTDTVHNAGGHIHISANALGEDIESWRQFIKLYILYESVIFRFIYGDKVNWRKRQMRFAMPMAEYLYNSLTTIDKINDLTKLRSLLIPSMLDRCHAMNFANVIFDNPNKATWKNTIEFRSPRATTNAIIWQNNINLFVKMLLVAKDKKLDEELLNYKLKAEYVPFTNNKYMYNIINLKMALEFVDIIFDNNLDKIYFLRQYLKDYQDGYNLNTTTKSKKFTR